MGISVTVTIIPWERRRLGGFFFLNAGVAAGAPRQVNR
jgi:hypothetical protein